MVKSKCLKRTTTRVCIRECLIAKDFCSIAGKYTYAVLYLELENTRENNKRCSVMDILRPGTRRHRSHRSSAKVKTAPSGSNLRTKSSHSCILVSTPRLSRNNTTYSPTNAGKRFNNVSVSKCDLRGISPQSTSCLNVPLER